ncbi:hypothetical protein RRG08_045549 [Elysia crispata]|uniref:Uncharacterized protein n=1 Tax=Elysia crispata TaxID=231223 RepID=A0AAE1AE02_9GAST|nr:hypothetical protein RRG08_045549 [Elysia crispata]
MLCSLQPASGQLSLTTSLGPALVILCLTNMTSKADPVNTNHCRHECRLYQNWRLVNHLCRTGLTEANKTSELATSDPMLRPNLFIFVLVYSWV